ncbi:hypothetical protein [Aquimarina intermedia]|uniref:Uncharacterized protein n=1 Tax=Aquimarina intermedia TaxID=350814 RepID=A0A5S5C0J3_9FLAO|nr:hypothetical protein [Aquimarina intermedia]TYP71483.1 hypothetical protein BD809_10965 [Aquimarina intermedia]
MGCFTDKLTEDIVNDCDNLSISGIESDVLLVPHSDFNKTATTINATNRMLVDDLVLNAGTTGLKLEGIKQTQGYNWEFVPSEETVDKFRHLFDGMIMTPSAANRLSASKLAKGQSYLVVVHKRYKGANKADAFLILGWDAGLYVTVMTENSRESDSAIKFTLSSKDDTLEYDMPRVLLESDYDTTLTAFNNKFAQPAVP